LRIDEKEFTKEFKQAGLSDNTIVCLACEQRFSPYDSHGIRAILDTFTAKQIHRDQFGKAIAYVGCSTDYALFKLFVLSMLWRASVSSLEYYEEIDLGQHEDTIRKMVENNDPGSEHDFPIVCFHQLGHKYPSTVHKPFRMRDDDGVNYCRLYLPHCFRVEIKVDARPIREAYRPWVLKPGSPAMFILYQYIGSYEMKDIELGKIQVKRHLGLPLRTTYRNEKPVIL